MCVNQHLLLLQFVFQNKGLSINKFVQIQLAYSIKQPISDSEPFSDLSHPVENLLTFLAYNKNVNKFSTCSHR